jgi:hypothetical protein
VIFMARLILQISSGEPSSPDMIKTGTSFASMPASADDELPALPIWAFTLGVFALLTFGLTAVPSIICGHVALARERARRGRSFGKSVALVGLVIGYVGAAVFGTWTAIMIRNLWS